MKGYEPEFLKDATNVYQTRDYIVRQRIVMRCDEEYGNYLYSYDTYYRCTPQRNKEYEKAFADHVNMCGKRIHTSMYAREYID